jgi:Domain of unknown function (DUF4129)
MKLEDLTVVLRPRQPWEAVDLGCALVRRDYGRILALWMATVLPVWILLGVCLWDYPELFMVIAWWLKPLYDRLPLHFMSRAAFGVRPGFVETWKQWPRLWSRFLFSALILRRFSFMRSFTLPVLMLEGQRGRAAWQRVKALASDGGSSGSMVSWVFLKLELVVFLGLWSLTSDLAPTSDIPGFMDLMDGADFPKEMQHGYSWYLNVIYLLAITAIEPFFVGAGFGLYLNSRTHLEGWDVELAFRKIATRLQPLMILLLLGLMSFSAMAKPQPAMKEDAAKAAVEKPAPDPVKESAKKILEHPDFKIHSRTQKVWVPDSIGSDRSVSPLIGLVLKSLIWLLVAALIGFVVYLIVVNRHLLVRGFRARAAAKPEIKGPRVIMGMDITRESLPAQIVAAAERAWRSGQHRVALSLLYRGSLSRLVEQRRLPIRSSDTEDDCLMHVVKAKAGGQETAYFSSLTRLWIRAAYAGQEASETEFAQLCAAWPFDQKAPAVSAAKTLLVLLPLFCLISCSGHWEDVEIKTGYKGKARTECFLAAHQLLEEYGFAPERRLMLDKMPNDASGVMVLSAENAISSLRAKDVLKWVEGGGHVIYVMAGCTSYNDWSHFSSMTGYGYFGNDERPDAMLKEMQVKVTDRRTEVMKELTQKGKKKAEDDKKDDKKNEKTKDEKEAKPEPEKAKKPEAKKPAIHDPSDVSTIISTLLWEGKSYEVELPDFVSFKLDRELRGGEFIAGPKDKAFVLGLRRGQGRVTLINHARPFRNRYLADHDHASWLIALMGEDAQDVWFISGMERSFMSLLWEHAWMVLLTLLALLVFWLWCHVPRFGPMRQVALHETKHFVDHIAALGHFFHRLKRDDVLLFDSAHQVRAKALERFPHLHGAGDAALLPRLAELSGLPTERIQAALMPPAKPAPFHLVALLKDLQTLRQSL